MEAIPSGSAFTVHTDVFDGPLDLLLHLVKRDGIALARLRIARIADDYLAYLDRMRSLDLAIAADWLVMAATLVHLKALELLPRPPSLVAVAEEVDPRDALLEQLADYERIKAAAAALDALEQVGRDVFVHPGERPPDAQRPFVSPVDAFGLLDVLFDVLRRGAPPERFKLGESGPDIGECCRKVVAALGGLGGSFDLGGLLRTFASRAERVITFIAVLEMCRLGWLDVDQAEHLAPIVVRQVVESDRIELERVMGVDGRPGEQLELPLEGSA